MLPYVFINNKKRKIENLSYTMCINIILVGYVRDLCFLQAMADLASPACILETRKTAPGLRLVDKWAV